MAREKKYSLKLSDKNEHLLDIFSDNFYLELGTIEYEPLNNLLSKKLVDYKDLSYYDIIKKGLGSMSCSSEELSYKLPFLYFNNLVAKNKSLKLVITYGLILRRNGYKEYFTPIILIPVKMYFENDTILFQMISKPVINPYLKKEKGENIENLVFHEKLDNILNIDKYILSFLKNHTNNIRLENYLTVINTKQSEINLHHEMFKLDNNVGSKLNEKYSVDCDNDIYNITPLDRVQRNAVAIANSGNSFALSGYLGTGKTTTLINVAADFIKDGNRVLYVSNNENTLKTVYDNFEKCGLNSYVSVLTNSFDKINSKNTELKKGQILDGIGKAELKEQYQKVDTITNHFASKIKNYLLIEIMNELILTPKPESLFSEKIMKNAYKLYKHEIKEVVNALKSLEKLMEKMPSFTNSHFINIPVTHNIDDPDVPLSLINDIYNNFCVLNEEKVILEKKYGFSEVSNYALFKNIIKNYFNLNKSIVPLSWYSEQNEAEELNERFYNFRRARELFEQIKEETSLSKHYEHLITRKYDVLNMDFDVKRAIKEITDVHFEVTDKKINNVLKDYVLIENELSKAVAYCKDLENNFNKLKLLLRFNLDLQKTKVVEEVLECIFVLDEGYFSKVWCDYEKRDITYKRITHIEEIVDRYEEAIKVYNKYFDTIANIDVHIKTLIKKNKDENRKYRGILIRELLPHLHFIKEYNSKIPQYKKDYFELTNTHYEYKVHISDIFKEFMEKHDLISDKATRIEIENSFKKISREQIKPLLSWAKEVKKAIINVNTSYDFFSSYSLVSNADNIVSKVTQLRNIIKYVKNVFKWQMKMHRLLKERKEVILVDVYLELSNNQDALNEINNKINNNQEYKFLYEKLFDGENTNIELLESIINDYILYLEIFKDPNCLVNSFKNSFNTELSIHLNSSESIIDEINNLFQNYVKIFKTNISKYYYDEFKNIIKNFKTLLESRDELVTYLAIANEMKILLKYKLYNLNNYIIYHNHELFTDRFKYSYFDYLYKNYLEKNPDFTETKTHEKLLEQIMFMEKDLIDNNAEVIKLGNRVYRTGKATHLDFNSFIEKNKNSKLLFLTDTTIANIFLNIDLFDLVIIDDAHMLHANEYNKVVNSKQIIIAGNEQLQTSISNNLMSRMRSTSIIKLRYRYSKSPLKLLSQFDDLSGRFYSDVKMNDGISVYKENYNQIILEKIINNPECKINFFTSSNSKIHNLIQNIGNALFDRDYSVQSIYNYFINNLNVCDISLGNVINADFNIIDLESYNDVENDYTMSNYMNHLLCCSKEVILLDNKNYLENNQNKFILKIKEIMTYELLEPELRERTIVQKISKSLLKYRVKTIGIYYPLHLLVEYDNKYFGIILIENPNNTEFTILNEYREFKSNDLPIIIRWLSDIVYDYDNIISGIVKEIRS